MRVRPTVARVTCALILIAPAWSAADAEPVIRQACHCKHGHHKHHGHHHAYVAPPVATYGYGAIDAGAYGWGAEAGPLTQTPYPPGGIVGAPPVTSNVAPPSVMPPPGTLGRTYMLPSRPVPADRHPRVGMLEVIAPNATEVAVHDLNDYRTEDTLEGFQDADDANIWYFESEPLLPGLPHIYRVEVQRTSPSGNVVKDERFVRLIRGRIVQIRY